MAIVTITPQSAASVPVPAVGDITLFSDSADSFILKTKDSGGIVRPFGVGTADELATTGSPVDVSAASPPNAGDRLRANTPTDASWAPDFNVTSIQVGGPYAAAFDQMVRVNVTGAPIQVDLPAVHTSGQKIGVKIIGLATNSATIDGNGNTIDGAATLVFAANPINDYAWAILMSDGANWMQVG